MRQPRACSGFTLIELLICIAVIGIVSAVAIPGYRSYIETANMSKVTSNFEEAVRMARNTFAKDVTRSALGLTPTTPGTTESWIELFNRTGVEAPGGGPAYIVSSNSLAGRGDADVGAVGVQWRPGAGTRPSRLFIWRPRYKSLVEQRAIITTESLDIDILRGPED